MFPTAFFMYCAPMLKHTPDLEAIMAAIVEDLAAGIDLPYDVLAFLEGVAGEATAPALQELLDSGDSSGQSVLDLIFFPELSLRKRLEPLVGAGVDPEDATTLAERLAGRGVSATLRFPDGGAVTVSPPKWVMASMVARMRLARHIPTSILTLLETKLGEEQALSYRTLLRSTRFEWSEEVEDFLNGFLERASCAPGQEARFVELFEGALQVLDDCRQDETVYACLMDRKRFFHAAMEKAQNYAEIAKTMPMEALLSKGVTPPAMTKEAAMKRIQLLDGISLTVYGRTDPLESPVTSAVPIDPGVLSLDD